MLLQEELHNRADAVSEDSGLGRFSVFAAPEREHSRRKRPRQTISKCISRNRVRQNGSLERYKLEIDPKGTTELTVTKKNSEGQKAVFTYKVVSIAKKALKGNKTLKSLTMGSNVISIGKSAIAGLKTLESVTIKSGGIKKIAKGAFSGISSKASFVIYAKEPEYTDIVGMIKKAGAASDASFEMKKIRLRKKKAN